MILNKFLAALLFAGAAWSGLILISVLFAVAVGPERVDYSISKGLEIERQFHEAQGVVDAFFAERGRFPSPSEFEKIGPDGIYTIDLHANGVTQFKFDCPRQFTEMIEGDYVLTTWQGEWMECYRPSQELSTVVTQKSDFTLLGENWLDIMFFLIVAATCTALAVWLSTRRPAKT